MYVTKDQIKEAKEVDLAPWLLNSLPGIVVRRNGGIILKENDHIWVKDGLPGYHDFRSGEGGDNIRFLQQYTGCTFQEAVILLCGGKAAPAKSETRPDREKSCPGAVITGPPEPSSSFRHLYAYLSDRGIPADVIQTLIDRHLLYQDRRNNIVFINPARDYYEIRGTNTLADRRCRHRETCPHSKPVEHGWCDGMTGCPNYKPSPFHSSSRNQGTRFWFFKPKGHLPCSVVIICESAIDAVSLYTMHRGLSIESPVYVSIGGVSKQKVIDFIKTHYRCVILAVDNDDAGDECRARNPELTPLIPSFKDWNEDLQRTAFTHERTIS